MVMYVTLSLAQIRYNSISCAELTALVHSVQQLLLDHRESVGTRPAAPTIQDGELRLAVDEPRYRYPLLLTEAQRFLPVRLLGQRARPLEKVSKIHLIQNLAQLALGERGVRALKRRILRW